ncbi:MAG: SBBP repeat-containing protein [Terriglobia bacterium]|jgi:hypothetical protein
MTKGIRYSFNSILIGAAIAIAAISAAMVVDFSLPFPRQNVPATKQALNRVSGAVNRPAGAAANPPNPLANRLVANYGKLPLAFEANAGQTDGRVKFLSRGRGYSLFLTGNEAVLTLQKASGVAPTGTRPDMVGRSADADVAPAFRSARAGLKSGATTSLDKSTPDNVQKTTASVLRMRLVGANAGAAVTGADELPGKSNYFIGNDPNKWRTNVSNYAKVRYQGVYPGVDLVYYGNQGGQLEYDFVVAPGADPSVIALDVAAGLSRHPSSKNGGAKPPLQIAADGDLVVKTDGGEIRFHKPVVYQEQFTVDSSQSTVQDVKRNTTDNPKSKIQNRKFLEGHYVLQADNQVGFKVASYDHTRPLVIDPVLSYATFLDGSGSDGLAGIAVDSFGNAYVAGSTNSSDFPTTTGAFETSNPGGGFVAAYISKLDPTGTSLVYSTFLIGIVPNGGMLPGTTVSVDAIAVDPTGNAYIAGFAIPGFPTTPGAYQTTLVGNGGYFVAKLNATGSALVYSTYFGPGNIEGIHMAVDPAGNAYLTGFTYPELPAGNIYSGIFPTTPGALEPNPPNPSDFAQPPVNGIPAGYPAPPACTKSPQYCSTAFVTKLNATGSALVYSTYLGGYGADAGNAIAADSSGNAYVTGSTSSYFWPGELACINFGNACNFPTTAGAFQPTPPIPATNCANINGLPCYNGAVLYLNSAFVTELNPTGSLVYSTFLGNAASARIVGSSSGNRIAADGSGNAYVAGGTTSNSFPTTPGAFQTALGGGQDAFVIKLNPSGSAPVYSTYLGGSGNESGLAIAVDSAGEAYVTGRTTSTNFPTVNPFQATNNGGYNGYDVFVSEFNAAGSALVSSSYLGGTEDDFVSGVGVDSSGNAYVAGYTYSTNIPTTPGAFQQTATAAPCVPFPIGYFPFTSVYGTLGGNVLVAQMTPAAFTAMESLPSATEFFSGSSERQGFCQSVQVYPGGPSYSLAIPSAAERQGNFSDISTQIKNPITGQTYPGNEIPPSAIPASSPGPWYWVLGGVSTPSGYNNYVAKISLASVVSPSSTSLPFGPAPVGASSAPLTETITNSGTDILTISTATISGTNASDFVKSADTCTGATVTPNDTCTVIVAFTPSARGSRSASLNLTDNASNSPQAMTLGGTGLALTSGPHPPVLPPRPPGPVPGQPIRVLPPAPIVTAPISVPVPTPVPAPVIHLASSPLAFSAQGVGTSSHAQTVTLTNTGSSTLTISGITASGDFSQTNTCPTTLSAGADCTISVTFTPVAAGTRTGTLSISDSATGSPRTSALSGTGLVSTVGPHPPDLQPQPVNLRLPN